jgi:23S rRNA (adenine2503-C2)-methyltransferase
MTHIASMKHIATIQSKTDLVEKFVFRTDDDRTIEATAINKHDGKWSICLPSQTGCNMGCKFCIMSTLGIKARNLTITEITTVVRFITERATIQAPTLLVSFMGAGEPLLNQANVIESMCQIHHDYRGRYETRFALATMAPSRGLFDRLIRSTPSSSFLDVKLHLSLHSTVSETRNALIPSSSVTPLQALVLLNQFSVLGHKIEVHYYLISGVNDSDLELDNLKVALGKFNIPACFIVFNEGASDGLHRASASRLDTFISELKCAGIEAHSYRPPGADIGASCGQFLSEFYV